MTGVKTPTIWGGHYRKCYKNVNLMSRKEGQYFSIFLLKLVWFGQAWPARPGLAGPAPAGPGLTESLSMQERPTSTKVNFLLENLVFGLRWPLSTLLDLKNGSRSKFYAG